MNLLGRFIRKNWGQMVYYVAVVLALCAFASAAQQIRSRRIEAGEEEVLPTVEMEQGAETQSGDMHYSLPEHVQILRNYAAQPEWNSENGCWQCHTGMDILFEDGQVISLSDGVVDVFGENGSEGGFVEVKSGAYCLRYCSVEPIKTIYEGMQVAAGEVIAVASKNMPGEAYLSAHLHLEIRCQDQYIDPLELLQNAD